mgnify:FL=1
MAGKKGNSLLETRRRNRVLIKNMIFRMENARRTAIAEELGLTLAKKEDIVGGTADENAIITKDILTGKEQGAKRDIVLLNAGAALYTIGKVETIKDGVKLAAEMIDSGEANEKLEQFIAYTNVK